MGDAWRSKVAQAQVHWTKTHGWAVAGLLKFTDGEAISASTADKLVRRFWQRMDTYYFGSLVRRQRVRIERATFLQFGEKPDSKNRHYHFVANPPLPVEFCGVAERDWAGLDRWCFGRDSEINLMRCSGAGGAYAARESFFDGLRGEEQSYQAHLSHFAFEHSHIHATQIDAVVQRRLFQRAA